MSENIEELRLIIEKLHSCKATYLEETVVMEKFGRETVWNGIVYTYRLKECTKADFCYAWSSPIEGSKKRRFYTVLKIPPIDSPEKAIRASIVHNHKIGKT